MPRARSKRKSGRRHFSNALTLTGDGKVTYSSSDTAVAKVDDSGQVKVQGISTAIIKATVTDSERVHYESAQVSYTLTVSKKSAAVEFAKNTLEQK